MYLFSKKIPFSIHPSFWILACLIGFIGGGNFIGFLLLTAVVIVSVITHELGHALAALYFGQRVHIELGGLGGATYRHGSVLSQGKEFLIILMGPLFGFMLFLISSLSMQLIPKESILLTSVLSMLVFVNFFWNLLNLLPVQPLDGGKLVCIVLERLFGKKGLRASYLLSAIFSIILSIYFFAQYVLIGGLLFLLFAYEAIRYFREMKNLIPVEDSEKLTKELSQVENDWAQGKKREAITHLEKLIGNKNEETIPAHPLELLGSYLVQLGEFEKACSLLIPYKDLLSFEPLKTLQIAFFETKRWQDSLELGTKLFREIQDPGIAILNSFASARLNNAEMAINWLKSASLLGVPDLRAILLSDEFDPIRHDPQFKELEKEYPSS